MRIEHNSRNEFYRFPFGAVTSEQSVRIRLGVNEVGIPNSVRLKYIRGGETALVNMFYVSEIGGYCFYEAVIPAWKQCGNIWYYFEVVVAQGTLYYGDNSKALGGIGEISYQEPSKHFQITVYAPDFDTPSWWRNSVCYQIFPDRFCNGNENGSFLGDRHDIIHRSWKEMPYYKPEQFGGEYLSNDFFGGNLKGIHKKLQYLAELGIDVIYLNPIFKAYSNHKYDTGDYMQIDEMFGTREDFKKLCKDAKKLGIRIILDGVFNHTGSNSRYFNKNNTYDEIGAYQSVDSPYFDWYRFSHWNKVYDSWWGMTTLPQVREESESYQEFMLTGKNAVVKHWLKEGASGWRLDVVDELPDFFVKKLRREVKKQDPEAVIIGEVWEDASNKVSYGEKREYFLGEELDSVMNYPLRDSLISLALGKINAEEFDGNIMSLKENYPRPAFYALLNMLSSHDMERILTVMSHAPDRRTVSKDWQASYHISGEALRMAEERVKQVVIFQMLLPGVPCIYYGDEAGLQGYGDPFCRNTYPWGEENQDMLLWYKTAVALRKGYQAYTDGEFETVYKIGQGYAFIRYLNDDKHIVAANFSDEPTRFRLDLARFNMYSLVNELYEEYYRSEDGIYFVDMPPRSVKVFSGEPW